MDDKTTQKIDGIVNSLESIRSGAEKIVSSLNELFDKLENKITVVEFLDILSKDADKRILETQSKENLRFIGGN